MESVQPPVEARGTTGSGPPPILASESRLSVPFYIRLPVATFGAFVFGVGLGMAHGGKTAGMRFRAENAHRFPTTPTGWYLYHKSKNYNSMLGAIKEGLKMGPKLGFWTGSFFLAEEAVDRWRGKKDFLSTVVAGMTIAAGFSGQPWSVSPAVEILRQSGQLLMRSYQTYYPLIPQRVLFEEDCMAALHSGWLKML